MLDNQTGNHIIHNSARIENILFYTVLSANILIDIIKILSLKF